MYRIPTLSMNIVKITERPPERVQVPKPGDPYVKIYEPVLEKIVVSK